MRITESQTFDLLNKRPFIYRYDVTDGKNFWKYVVFGFPSKPCKKELAASAEMAKQLFKNELGCVGISARNLRWLKTSSLFKTRLLNI